MFNLFNKENTIEAREVSDIRRTTITTLCPIIDAYVNWYCEHGITLPEEFAQDPTTWSNHLRTIQRAFNLAAEELEGFGTIRRAKELKQEELVISLLLEQQEGFELFGKYIDVLIDPLYK